MKIALIGPPGCGKGTQATFICNHLNIPHISIGRMLRDVAEDNKCLDDLMNRGELIPDSTITELIKTRLDEEDCTDGFLLDGFPRTSGQAQVIELDHIIEISLLDKEIYRRLSVRRRDDDQENIISNRIKIYRENIIGVEGNLSAIDGNQTINQVSEQIFNALGI